MMVGDNYDFDVHGARAAGLQAIHLDRAGGGTIPDRARIASLHALVI